MEDSELLLLCQYTIWLLFNMADSKHYLSEFEQWFWYIKQLWPWKELEGVIMLFSFFIPVPISVVLWGI